MHSILESDGVSSDPYEVLCHMGTLIIEGRTPNLNGGETPAKSSKPYGEGPHCPNFAKLHNKDSHPVHKCAAKTISCIRYSNLKHNLKSLQQKSASITIEVSLGPDCLCGELRSQSTLVTGQPSKRDVILEQWTISIGHKGMREPSSRMSVMNLYQAVRSLLHFSQLSAWYMCSNGTKPSNVIYRIAASEDATFISDDKFVSHDFPMADINKSVWMKISVKTLPRMEKIPSVFCPQHPSSSVADLGHSSQETKEKTYQSSECLHSKFAGDGKEESLPLKFQGVRKKTYDERKRKKYITLYNTVPNLGLDSMPEIGVLDGLAMGGKKMPPEEGKEFFKKRMFRDDSLKSYLGESSKVELKKSKYSNFPSAFLRSPPFTSFQCNYLEAFTDPGLKSFSDNKSDFRTKGKISEGAEPSPGEKKNVMDILDDRMQISCAISGKHHCKWEFEEENDLNELGDNVDKPKRRRSVSRARESEEETEKVLHGKFPHGREEEPVPGCSALQTQHSESPPKNDSPKEMLTPKIECLPILNSNRTPGGSSLNKPSPSGKGGWIRTETFESFRRGCAFAKDSAEEESSDSEEELSDSSSNPFLAAILRTARKYKAKKDCDNSAKCKGEVRSKPRLKNLDLKLNSWKESQGEEDESSRTDNEAQDLKREEKLSSCEDLYDSNNLNSTKTIPVPSAHEKLKFRRSLDSAAQLVFHRCSGLPLTSSPAPVRRHNSSFSFDSTLNSVSAIKSALFEPSNSLSSEDENESEGSLKSPASPGAWSVVTKQINYHSLSPLPLLGSFEESVLNGRLEPVSTVQGFTAELGASGSFCPRHLHLPVTVFFYTLGDNDKVCAPYLGHINLGKKGYCVPRSGTIQVTLFNPLRTVVKMFVVVYDLHDMPPNSHTFLRQRTLYVPTNQKESTATVKKDTPFEQDDYHKYLRYLIHLRFVSGKTGRIYLHTDIRMVIFRKADEDTATALDDGETYELRSHTHGPINPKFSPRK